MKIAILSALVAMVVALGFSDAHAVSLVTTTVTDQMADTTTDQTSIGTYVIGAAALAFGINWIKATFF